MQEKFQKIFDIITREVSLDYFEIYVLRSSDHINELFEAIRECRTQGFPRFNIWRMILEVIPIKGTWQEKKTSLQASRKRWLQLKEEARSGLKSPPHKVKQTAPVQKNPLMKIASKPEKKVVQSDSFLNEEIKKDVDRTYQQMSFFQDSDILKLLTNVLFVWSKINSDISYKQGMNQLLAEIVYVYFLEAVPVNYQASSELEEKYLYLNSVANAEADIFIVFERIMEIQKDMYKENLDDDLKGLVNPNSKNNSPILQRIIQIQDQKLKSTDLELFRVLKLQDVKTKTFLLRWIRCMHTREFGLVNSLFIWDSIFLDAYQSPNSKNRKQYEFVDAMCLAMFIYLRAVVLTRETSNEILQIYQKYPQLEGHYLYELIRLAWSVCEELRNLATNPTSNSNWYQQSDKVRKLGLIEKGGYVQTMKKQQTEKKKQHRNLFPVESKEKEVFTNVFMRQKQQNGDNSNEIARQPLDIPAKLSPAAVHKESEDDDFFLKPKKQSSKQQSYSVGKQRVIHFEQKQVKSMIENLKQSNHLNEDLDSRIYVNKVLKLLQAKLKK